MIEFKLGGTSTALLLLLLAVFQGCSGDPHGVIGAQYKSIAKDRMRSLHMMYSMHNSIHMRSPKDEAELREFIAGDRAKIGMERLGISPSDFDDYLISDWDDEPFEIIYGIPFKTIPDKGYPYVFDTVGRDGVRRVYFTDGRISEIEDESEFEKLKKSGLSKKGSKEIVQ